MMGTTNHNINNNNSNNSRNWKKVKEQSFHGGGSKPRSSFCRKSSVNGEQLSMLQMEAKFCATVGGVSLKQVMEGQRYININLEDEKVTQKVMQWKDSAVQEAFRDAKQRFWAMMHKEPCDIELPDPDVFIDRIDWDSSVDPKLMLDLDNREPDDTCETEKRYSGVVLGIPMVSDQYVLTSSGWGDAEDVAPQPKNGENYDDNVNWDWGDNGVPMEETGWSQGCADSYDYAAQKMDSGWDSKDFVPASNDFRTQWDQGQKKQWDHAYRDQGYNRKSGRGDWNTSRYKISRFQHNDQPSADDYGSRKGNFSYQRPPAKWQPVTSRS